MNRLTSILAWGVLVLAPSAPEPAKVGAAAVPCIDSPRCYERFVAFRAHSPWVALLGSPPHLH